MFSCQKLRFWHRKAKVVLKTFVYLKVTEKGNQTEYFVFLVWENEIMVSGSKTMFLIYER